MQLKNLRAGSEALPLVVAPDTIGGSGHPMACPQGCPVGPCACIRSGTGRFLFGKATG